MSYDLMTPAIAEIPVIFGNRNVRVKDLGEREYNVSIFKSGKKVYSGREMDRQSLCSALVAKDILSSSSLEKLNAQILITTD